jgi:hypothetical protein
MGQTCSSAKATNIHGEDYSVDTSWRKRFAQPHTPSVMNFFRIRCVRISFVVETTLNRFDMKWIEFVMVKVLRHAAL